ncbi:MAG: PQQ-dependent sugar dehydrogenase [Nitrosomonas sp.]|uniref:PQQ-dependent sugar dehydrogenase n=1 Tax=Nitrosomonas sp. TaxID=42353 RepID=UPI001D4B2B55|nr:PQQ-dependent sugar dehydrogenase [Nitrosomonas sp.]MBX9895250.1 PQQ-dependent sugar dehydrogenase [Nitrosomonas sp.]
MKTTQLIVFVALLGLTCPAVALDTATSDAALAKRLDNPIPATIEKGTIRVRLKTIASGLAAPNWGVPAPGDSEYLYVSDQNGKLWRINLADGSKLFFDLSALLVPLGAFGSESYDERGLLGFAFHPQYADNELIYTYTSEPASASSDFSTIPPGGSANHRSVIREWKMNFSKFATEPEPMDVRVLLTVDQPQFNHNGGALNFGPDNRLYIAFGDGGGADDRDGQTFIGAPMIGHGINGNGQNPANPLGSLLRIDPLGSNSDNGSYGIPTDNPFAESSTVLRETYAYGFRNPFRFSFDLQTGALVLADVGQNAIEEINLIQSGGNYGWGLKEGSFRFDPNGTDAGFVTNDAISGDFKDPVVQYDHDEGTAVIGGFVYRGNTITDLQGKYVLGDASKTGSGDGRIFYTDGVAIYELDFADRAQSGFWVLGFGQDGDGEIYVLGNTTGTPFGETGVVYKLIPNAGFDGSTVDIPAITARFSGGDDAVYRARMQMIAGSAPLRFEVSQVEPLAERFRDDATVFTQATGQLQIPFINVTNDNGSIATYAVVLQQITDAPALTFELVNASLVK